jgi:hypothetical protein
MSNTLNQEEKSSTENLELSKMSQTKLQEEAWAEAMRRATPRRKIDPRYLKFQKTYYNDWAAFVHDCFEWKEGRGPTFYQDEILNSFQDNPRQSIRGPHGLGKTALAAWIVHAFSLTRDGIDWKAITTASVWRQLTKFLWPEIHKWARLIKWSKIGRPPYDFRYELQTLQLKLQTGAAFAVASDNHTAIEGAHADSLFYIYDESKSVIDATFDASEGAFSGAGADDELEAYGFAISTPGEPVGRFYDIHRRAPGLEDWNVRHITLEDSIASKRISEAWAKQRKRQWGEGSAVYQNRVLGEFASADADGVIPLEWVEAAMVRWEDWQDSLKTTPDKGKLTSLGVDIGSGEEGRNLTVLAKVYDGHKIDKLDKKGRGSVDHATMDTANRVMGILRNNPLCNAFVDSIGIGLGVYHRLKEMKFDRAFAFNSSQRTTKQDRDKEFGFVNKRSAAWWLMREALDPINGTGVCLPRDDALLGELIAPKYSIAVGGMLKVEGKDDIMKRIERSTDSADAIIYAITGNMLAKAPITQVYVTGQGRIY